MKNEVVKDVSNQIGIEVVSNYQREFSNPVDKTYLFAYQIKITNHSAYPVQLQSRKWFIFDSSGKQTIVQGEGVVGQHPTLEPGESFQYISSCPLESPLGYMHGEYSFVSGNKGKRFTSIIPKFTLTCPDILN